MNVLKLLLMRQRKAGMGQERLMRALAKLTRDGEDGKAERVDVQLARIRRGVWREVVGRELLLVKLLRIAMEGLGLRRDVVEGRVRVVLLFYDGRVSDAVPVELDGGRVKEILPIDAALLLYDFPELVTPSVEYQLVRPKTPGRTLHVRVECAKEGPDEVSALRDAIARRFVARIGVEAEVEMLPRGALPRFDYKAARVVSA